MTKTENGDMFVLYIFLFIALGLGTVVGLIAGATIYGSNLSQVKFECINYEQEQVAIKTCVWSDMRGSGNYERYWKGCGNYERYWCMKRNDCCDTEKDCFHYVADLVNKSTGKCLEYKVVPR